jgi:hypothetical protein
MEGDFSAGALLGRVDDAGVEGAGVDVHANSALVEFARVEDAMNRFEGIDGTWLRDVHLDDFGGSDGALAGGNVLVEDVIVFDAEAADGDGHPAILIAMVVDGAGLADFPADGDEFVERSFVDEITGVVLAVPGEVRGKRIRTEGRVLKELTKLFGLIEGGLGKLAELRNKSLDGDLLKGGGHEGAPGRV